MAAGQPVYRSQKTSFPGQTYCQNFNIPKIVQLSLQKNTFSLEEYKVNVIYFSYYCLLEIEIEPDGGRVE